jgi:hypothetical protein
MINKPKRNTEFFYKENGKSKSDIWHYTKVKKGSTIELNLNIVDINILWKDTIINPDKFDTNLDQGYIHAPFDYKMFTSLHWQKQ